MTPAMLVPAVVTGNVVNPRRYWRIIFYNCGARREAAAASGADHGNSGESTEVRP